MKKKNRNNYVGLKRMKGNLLITYRMLVILQIIRWLTFSIDKPRLPTDLNIMRCLPIYLIKALNFWAI